MTVMHDKALADEMAGDMTGQGTKIDGRILVVAGSDSSGGAGIQADIKAITALGGYAMTAVTGKSVV